MQRFDQEPRKKKFLGIFGRRDRQEPSEFLQMWLDEQAEEQRIMLEAARQIGEVAKAVSETYKAKERRRVNDQERIIEKQHREATIGREFCAELEQEIQSTPLVQFAEDIRKVIWKNTHHARVSLQAVSVPNVTLSDDGTQIQQNRSLVGRKLSYHHEDVVFDHSYSVSDELSGSENVDVYKVDTVRKELRFGIGYFDEGEIIPEARGLVPAGRLERGVKALFIQKVAVEPRPIRRIVKNEEREVGKEEIRTVRTTAIPVGYPEALNIFRLHLIQSLKNLSPNVVISQANERVQAHRGWR